VIKETLAVVSQPGTSRLERLLTVGMSLSVVFICAMIVFLTFTMLWPYTVVSKLIITVPSTVIAEETLPISVDYCKEMRLSPNGRWSLQNDITIELQGGVVALPIGCHATTVEVPLSDHVPAGRYKAVAEATYWVWPWRSIRYRFESNPFTLVRK
jgi:hypothetical protein